MFKLKLLIMTVVVSVLSASAFSNESIDIPTTNVVPLFDGHCSDEEWSHAIELTLPANTSIHLMHNNNSLFVCAKGKPEDYTVIDLYIENSKDHVLYNLHASAQLLERVYESDEWSKSEFWNQQNWGGFWVPYAGEEEVDGKNRTKFLEGSHREIQIKRNKFSGDSWNMMISLSAIFQNGEYGAQLTYPEKAVDTDASTWVEFTFK